MILPQLGRFERAGTLEAGALDFGLLFYVNASRGQRTTPDTTGIQCEQVVAVEITEGRPVTKYYPCIGAESVRVSKPGNETLTGAIRAAFPREQQAALFVAVSQPGEAVNDEPVLVHAF